jgi:NADPH:quinone reductase-like Zn-dependent oxidoreductase
VGSAAIQIAKLFGAEVITTASSRAKLDRAAELGADHLVNYAEEEFPRAVRRITGKRGVDIVFEHTGEATWPGSLQSVARGGKIVTCGATSGFTAVSDLRIVFFKQVSILGSTMGSLGEVLEVMDHVAAGRLRPVLDRTFPMSEVAAAHRWVESREQFGKVVILPEA